MLCVGIQQDHLMDDDYYNKDYDYKQECFFFTAQHFAVKLALNNWKILEKEKNKNMEDLFFQSWKILMIYTKFCISQFVVIVM